MNAIAVPNAKANGNDTAEQRKGVHFEALWRYLAVPDAIVKVRQKDIDSNFTSELFHNNKTPWGNGERLLS